MNIVEHVLRLSGGDVRVLVQPPLPVREETAACAFVFGRPGDGCLVRVHSRCLYGDVFGSLECDCGPQLQESIDLIQQHGAGLVIYLEQEGRGAGLLAKALAYQYSEDTAADTYAAYEALHLPLDLRSYEAAAALIRQLNIRRVTLLTNNPAKIASLWWYGIDVRHHPLTVPVHESAAGYLETKRRHGHLLDRVEVVATRPSIGGRHRRLPADVPERGRDNRPSAVRTGSAVFEAAELDPRATPAWLQPGPTDSRHLDDAGSLIR